MVVDAFGEQVSSNQVMLQKAGVIETFDGGRNASNVELASGIMQRSGSFN